MRRPRAVITTTVPVTLNAFYRVHMRQLSEHYEVHLVSAQGPELERLERECGVTTHALSMTRDISPLTDLRALLGWVLLLVRLRPRVLIAATPKASLLSMLSARALRVPHRLYLMGGLRLEGSAGRQRQVLTLLERLTFGSATAAVANSPSLGAKVLELRLCPPERLSITRPGSSRGVDAERFSPRGRDRALAADLGIPSDALVVGFVGRLTHDKGIDALLTAARILAERGAALHWLVVGAQIEADSATYAERLQSVGLNVSLVPGAEDVRPYFALMHVHVLPSLREGFPNVVLEASAMAIPTITTDATGCIDSVLPEKTGLIVPSGDGPALADAISRLADDRELRRRMGDAGRAWVLQDFDPTAVVTQVLSAVTPEARKRPS